MAPKEPRLTGIDMDGSRKQAEFSRLHVSPVTANLVRRVARAEGMHISEFVEELLIFWIKQNHPEWEMTTSEESAAQQDWKAGQDPDGIFRSPTAQSAVDDLFGDGEAARPEPPRERRPAARRTAKGKTSRGKTSKTSKTGKK